MYQPFPASGALMGDLSADYAAASFASVSFEDRIRCNWGAFRGQMLLQWKKLSSRELDEAGPSRPGVARLIERKYGIASDLVENYLRNLERSIALQ
jgi:hypothetical protein